MSGPLVRRMSGPLVRRMSGPLVRFADTRAACPYQKTAHSISCHVRISEACDGAAQKTNHFISRWKTAGIVRKRAHLRLV